MIFSHSVLLFPKINRLRLVFGLVFCVLALLFSSAYSLEPKEDEESKQIYQMLKLLGEVLDTLDEDYVDYIDKKSLIESAIKGALDELDPHTVLLTPESYSALNETTSGKFGGLGIKIEEAENGGVRIVAPIKDTPAYNAGMKTNDVIVAVNGVSILEMDIRAVVELMRGEEGTSVEITFLRDEKELKLVLERAIIRMQPTEAWLEEDIGYIKLTSFNRNADSSVREVVRDLQSENSNIRGYIFDLRQNPGGLLDQALKISDLFLDAGEIVSVRSEKKERQSSAIRFQAKKGDILNGLPLVVLVDGGSASASEIVAGALQDHERAKLVGSQTYGKGSVQNILDVGSLAGMEKNTYGLKITVQRYFTPSGELIDGSGLSPDVEIARDGKLEDVRKYQSEKQPEDVQLAYALREVQRLFTHQKNFTDTSNRNE